MQIEDFTPVGALRRWYLLDGMACCPFDAVDPLQISADDKVAILARNATVREDIEAVEAYEAALLVSKQEEPEPATEEVPVPGTNLTPSELPEIEERETAAHARWIAARATVDAATKETKALAQRRTGFMPDDGDEDPFTGKPLPPKSYPADPVPEDDLTYTPVVDLAPDNPTLGDWRVGLLLWGRLDTVMSRVDDLINSKSVVGLVARQRLEYSNNVLRSELLQIKEAFGFTSDEVEESLWRAEQVRQGDLSGMWPLPTEDSA